MISPDRARSVQRLKIAIRYPEPGCPAYPCKFTKLQREIEAIGGKIELSPDDEIVGSINDRHRLTWHRDGRLARFDVAIEQNGKPGVSRMSFSYDYRHRLTERTVSKTFDGQLWKIVEHEVFDYSSLHFTTRKPISNGLVVV